MTAIIDYGVGNLFSLMSSLEYVGINTKLTDDEKTLDDFRIDGNPLFCQSVGTKQEIPESGTYSL